MPATEWAKSGLAIRIGSDTERPEFFGIGIGSAVGTDVDVSLGSEVLGSRNSISSSNFSGVREWTVTAAYDSVALSGLNIGEFGIFTKSGTDTGSAYTREGFTPVTFTGDEELFISVTWQLFPWNNLSLFTESWINSDFRDAATTAFVDTTGSRLRMTSATDKSQSYFTIWRSTSYVNDGDAILTATITSIEERWGNDVIRYYASINGGTDWEEITLGSSHTFTAAGSDFRTQIVFAGNGANDTFVRSLTVNLTRDE